MSGSEGCFLKTINGGCLLVFLAIGGLFLFVLNVSKDSPVNTSPSKTSEVIHDRTAPPVQQPVSAPVPDWDARRAELYSLYLAAFQVPALGGKISLSLTNGNTINGVVEALSESEIRVQRGAASIGFLPSQLTLDSRIKCFATDYATFKADLHLSDEKKTHTQASQAVSSKQPFRINIFDIAGQSPEAVEKILGEPSAEDTTQHKGRQLPELFYKNGEIEIVYVRGQADWITINGDDLLPFHISILSNFGIPPHPPTLSNNFTIRWDNINGIREINLFPAVAGKIHYAFICVNTVP